MKEKNLLIFSDSHGRFSGMKEVIERFRGNLDTVLFLGDGAGDFLRVKEEFSGQFGFLSVKGNCDIGFTDIPSELCFDFYGVKLFICHGNTTGVKFGYDKMAYKCREKSADVGLFGHTHIREDILFDDGDLYEKPLRLFNPGSITLPAEGKRSFGVLTVTDGAFLLSHGEL